MIGQSKWLTPSFFKWMKPSLSARLWVIVMALGTYYVQDSFKMCNAFLMDVDNIFVLTDQSSDLKQSYACPSQKK